ncbi:MAG: hypothetical protein M1836_001010 [Candelina mexicana]|nr:MAG: hypothetical protein M1836_001010 [Candelina mexicana]
MITNITFKVWVIGQTEEVFLDYEKYLNRMDFYNQRRFICEITGHSALTFFEALKSEMEGSKDVDKAFPDALREPVLRKVQFSTISRIDNLDFFPGEHVTVLLSDGERLNGSIREKAKFPAAADQRAFSRYFVTLTNRPGEEALVDDEHVQRDRKSFTKQMLRSFIKNTVTREAWTGAPWLVKDKIAKELHIDTRVPAHLQHGNRVAEKRATLAQKKGEQDGSLLSFMTTPRLPQLQPKSHKSKLTQQQIARNKHQQFLNYQQALAENPSFAGTPVPFVNPATQFVNHFDNHYRGLQPIAAKGSAKPPPPPPIKYPIEDLEVKPAHDGTNRPRLKYLSWDTPAGEESDNKSCGILMESVGPLLETWNTLNVYCEIFLLDSFTFDDYIQALQIASQGVDCELHAEVHCSALKLLVQSEKEGGKVMVNLPALIEEDSEDDQSTNGTSTLPTPTPEPEVKTTGRATRSSLAKSDVTDAKPESNRSHSTTLEIKNHRAAEMLAEYGWVDRLRRRDFRDGGWEIIIVGLLHQLSLNNRYQKTCEELLTKLAPVDEEPNQETARTQYGKLDINLRVKVVQIICMLTVETKVVRGYMEECSEQMTGFRKEKIEWQRSKKIAIEELRVLNEERKILLPDNSPPSPEITSIDDISMPDIEDDEVADSDDEDPRSGRSLRRGNDRAAERKRKREAEEKEKKEKAESAAKPSKVSNQFKKILKDMEKKKEVIKECEEQISTLENDLREADCPRTKVLGKDRFWNRYYYMERNGMPYAGLPTSSTVDAGYANGCIWVQGPDDLEREGFIELPEEDNKQYRKIFQMTIPERKKMEEGPTSVYNANQWGYYDDPDAFDMLIGWLDVRGVRELKLRKELQAQREHIVESMQKRKEYLAQAEKKYESNEQSNRMSTRTKTYVEKPQYRCAEWENDMAKDELGHIHSEQPSRARKVAKKTPLPTRDTRAGNKGKPLTRQGSRYNF